MTQENKKNRGENSIKFSRCGCKILIFIRDHTWILTILFFTTVFVAALYVWSTALLNKKLNAGVLEEQQKQQNDVKVKIGEIEKTIEKIQAREERFGSQLNLQGQRDMFKWPVEGNETKQEKISRPSVKNIQ